MITTMYLTQLSMGARGLTLMQMIVGMSFPPAKKLRLGYKATIPTLRTNENFTLETANSIFSPVSVVALTP